MSLPQARLAPISRIMSSSMARAPELLAPAGNWDCARAAVANGADAIYFGLPRFNARMRADNFTEEDLPELVRFLHQHGVKAYCAFNVLIWSDELDAAQQQLKALEAAGVDAVIVQDLGLAMMVKALAPGLHLHASTQMTLTSPAGLQLARQLGVDQAVLARELSLRELAAFRANETADLPLEVFVHGALCVAYSGQCLTSESLGQRSANRGECAQACRMPYEMIVDGQWRDLGPKRYLLSPQDLAAVREIPRLVQLGIASFKIEGRLKTPEYVAAVTQVYRKAIDAAVQQREASVGLEGDVGQGPELEASEREQLEMTFSRGLYPGWMHGVNHQELVGALYGKKRGPLVGRIRSVQGHRIELEVPSPQLKVGDGVAFENLADTNDERGGRLHAIEGRWLIFRRENFNAEGLVAGMRVFKTSDQVLQSRLRQSFQGELAVRPHRPLRLRAEGRIGEPLILSSLNHPGLQVASVMPLQAAQKQPLNEEKLRAQLERLGGTGWRLDELQVAMQEGGILPLSELNRMRRALLEAIESRPAAGPPKASHQHWRELLRPVAASEEGPTQLSVLCRNMEQAQAALQAGVRQLNLDFEDVRRYAQACSELRDQGAEIWLATPRIIKPNEEGFLRLIDRAGPDGVLVRNLGAITLFKACGRRMMGDFSLNVANPLTAQFLLDQGLERLTLSYDLNFEQIRDLLRESQPALLELTLHQHMPMFHMEHCAFAAFLSTGTNFTNCGRPCDHHRVELRDRVGVCHPLKADAGCRNTLFNAKAQSGAQFYEALRALGLRHFRIELLNEDAAKSAEILKVYQGLIAGQVQAEALWQGLKLLSQLGVTRGTLDQL